ncbi:DUF6266 family protein [Gaoshiqia sediminis]|uniref:DUF6266 family protein n=1 Tax=Gaoshiqia sediminis TaxID=2986998 RepID=A0AA41YAW1_9BACT|nr:DUF6266 family protein [Gaoshiqia sediminis]MCW0482723.1 DUF6266 family protein [Gaoshiqia sediminis]
MGKISQGILGGFSGKVGTVIGGSWKGIDYMRSVAASVSNPRTPAQMDQRTRFATAISFLQPLTSFIRVGFKNYAVKMSAFNAAMAYTLRNAILGDYPDYFINYADALVSRGSLPGALNATAASTVPGQVNFTWEDNSGDGAALATDQVLLVLYNPLKKQAVTVIGGSTRSAGSQVVTVPSAFASDELNCYIAFQNENLSEVSNSTYLGEVVVS